MAGCAAPEGGWCAWLKKELTWNKKLIPIKVIQFLYSGGTSSLFPYLTLHMQQLGITVTEIGTIYTLLPIASILGPPVSGLVADRFGNFKVVVLLSMVLTVVFHVVLLYVPARPAAYLPVSCQGDALTWSSCHGCLLEGNTTSFQLTLQDCEYRCESPPSSHVEICLHDDASASSLCNPVNLTHPVTFNGTVTTWVSEDKCGHTWRELLHEGQVFHSLTCPSQCPVECRLDRMPPCQFPDDPSLNADTFWIYFVLRMIGTFFMTSLFTMMDAVTLAVVKQHNGDYGKQRFLFILGLAIVPPIAGLLVDVNENRVGYTDYMPAFYLGGVLCLASALLIARLRFTVDKPSEHFLRDLKQLVTLPQISVYLVMILVMGSNWGFLESYLFVYLQDLGAPNYLLGMTLTVGSVVGLPIMLIADRVVEKLHRPAIFVISFFTYAVRHIGYSYINDPWLVMPFEVLEVFTYQLMWVAAITYCPVLAPRGLLATMTALAGTVHFSLGKGLGSLVGGYLIVSLDMPLAFRTYGGIAAGCGILYVLVHFFCVKKRIMAREEELREEERQRRTEDGRPMLENQAVPPSVIINKNTADSAL